MRKVLRCVPDDIDILLPLLRWHSSQAPLSAVLADQANHAKAGLLLASGLQGSFGLPSLLHDTGNLAQDRFRLPRQDSGVPLDCEEPSPRRLCRVGKAG